MQVTQRMGSCYLEVSFGTTGVDTWCYLVLPGVLLGVIWALPGVAWRYLGFYFGVFFLCGPKISAFLKLKLLEKKSISTWRCYLGPRLFTWPTL